MFDLTAMTDDGGYCQLPVVIFLFPNARLLIAY
jgi:hypothetical protein